jgi:hypothetical protein
MELKSLFVALLMINWYRWRFAIYYAIALSITNYEKSSIFAPASHPYIYRAVFVDGRIHAPDL